jgi:hypothetical protein
MNKNAGTSSTGIRGPSPGTGVLRHQTDVDAQLCSFETSGGNLEKYRKGGRKVDYLYLKS